MADPQRLVDDIRHFLQAGDHAASDAVRALAQEYAEACQQAQDEAECVGPTDAHLN